MAADPIRRFNTWLREARSHGIEDPEAGALATADAEGRPSVRYVLVKEADPLGLVFFSNSGSRKGREMEENPRAALAFYWRPDRQVRVEGKVRHISGREADLYWSTRPRETQIAAIASDQSRPLSGRKELSDAFRKTFKEFDGREISRPADWIGYRLVPDKIEFWTREEPRLHLRELFTRARSGWKRTLLQP